MAIIVDFIRNYAPWAYGACALLALWYLRSVLVARRDRRYAVFTLEREAALNRVYSSWTAAIILIVVMGLVYALSTVVFEAVEPLVEETEVAPTVVVGAAPSITPTLPVSEATFVTDTPTARPRPTRRPAPTLSLVTPTPAIRSPGCPDPNAVITSPGVNQVVSGMVPIMGRAFHESFDYYKLEYGAGSDPQVWSYFDGADTPAEGRLGTLNAGALAPGTYSVRVVVVDATGNFPTPCRTIIVVQ